MDTVLAAIFCSVVAFFVGVIAAPILPARLCISLGNAAEWAAGLGSIATAITAWKALESWRDQIRGASRHAAAAEIVEAVRLMRYHFYDARNPLYDPAEFPSEYLALREPRSNVAEAEGWAYVYERRYRHLNKQILRLATLRAKAGALLGEESATALEELARKARALHGYFRNKVYLLRQGGDAVVSHWHKKQHWIQRVNDSVVVSRNDRSDSYSLEFEAKFDALIDLVQPFII